MDFNEFLDIQLKDLENKGLRRSLKTVSGMQSSLVLIDGKKYLNFCSNNYLGLANDSRLGQAALNSLKQGGIGAGASRLVCGNIDQHRELEKTLAEFKGTESCLLFSTGYMANLGIISSLFNRHDVIFSDRLNHASIIDGIQLSGAAMKRYPHCDMDALEKMLKEDACLGKRAIITDTVFSMDGDIAPLHDIVDLAKKYDCIVIVDEAHGFGVFGENGRGVVEHFGLEDDIDVQMGTLSKAAGCFGAYVCGSQKLIDFLINKARSFIYTTGMPPMMAAAGKRAVEIIKSEAQTRKALWENTNYMRASLKMTGFNTLKSTTPIIPIVIGDNEKTVEFSKRLYEKQVLIGAIRPPTVPENTARLRMTMMVSHTKKEIDWVLDNLQRIGKELCLI